MEQKPQNLKFDITNITVQLYMAINGAAKRQISQILLDLRYKWSAIAVDIGKSE